VQWDRRNARVSGLEGGGARPSAEIRWEEDLRLFAAADLLGADAPHHLAEAFAAWHPSEGFRLRAGLLRVALGTESATAEPDLPLVGYAFPAHLDRRTDVGAQVTADLLDGGLFAEATWAAGCGFGLDGSDRDAPQASLRVAGRPARLVGARALDGWFAGLAFAALSDFEDPVVLRTPLGSTVFRTEDLDGDGGRWLHAETGLAAGPAAVGLEVVRGRASGVSRAAGGRVDMDQITAWSASAAISLTGERREWARGAWRAPVPAGAGGAWEFAARYSNGDLDRALFDEGWTTYDPSTQEVRTFSALLGWRPCVGVRVALGWTKTIADDSLSVFGWRGGPGPVPRLGNDDRDSSFVLRVEVSF